MRYVLCMFRFDDCSCGNATAIRMAITGVKELPKWISEGRQSDCSAHVGLEWIITLCFRYVGDNVDKQSKEISLAIYVELFVD